MISLLVLAVLLGLGAAGALLVVFAREVLRVALGLGVLLLVVAGLFLYYDAPFLAVAQVFIYAGGVPVLLLFALMLLRRDTKGRLVLVQNHDIGAAVVSVAVFVLIGIGYATVQPATPALGAPVERIAFALLGPYLPQFEAVALLLLVALVGAIAIVAPVRAAAAQALAEGSPSAPADPPDAAATSAGGPTLATDEHRDPAGDGGEPS